MKKMDTSVCKTGYIKCNKFRHQRAAIVLYEPAMGFIRVAFGSGDNLSQEDCLDRDRNGNRIDDYLYITTYTGEPEDGCWEPALGPMPPSTSSRSGLLLEETDGGQMLYSRKSWPHGDLRELLPEALEFMGWPRSLKKYFVAGYEGAFWDRPLPKGARA